MATLQGANYLFPIVSAPYLIRVIGIQKYGLWATASALLTYFQMITDYGYNLSATREVSLNRHDRQQVSRIFSETMGVKLLLFCLSLALMLALTGGIPALRREFWFYLAAFAGLLGSVIFPVWLYQGLEEMRYITYLQLAARSAVLLLLFVLVKRQSDYMTYAVLNSAASIAAGGASLWLAMGHFGIRYSSPTLAEMGASLKRGWYIFASTFSVNMYVSSNVLILRLVADEAAVGYYYVAERCVVALRSMASTIFQAIYPHVCAAASESSLRLKAFFRRITLPMTGLFFLASLALFLSSRQVVHFFTGGQSPEAVNILRIMSFVPLVVAANIPAYQTLLSYDLKRTYTSLLVAGSALNIMLNLILASRWQGTGTAVSVLATEIFITVGLYLAIELRHRHLSLFRE